MTDSKQTQQTGNAPSVPENDEHHRNKRRGKDRVEGVLNELVPPGHDIDNEDLTDPGRSAPDASPTVNKS